MTPTERVSGQSSLLTKADLSIRQIAKATVLSSSRVHQLLHDNEALDIPEWLDVLRAQETAGIFSEYHEISAGEWDQLQSRMFKVLDQYQKENQLAVASKAAKGGAAVKFLVADEAGIRALNAGLIDQAAAHGAQSSAKVGQLAVRNVLRQRSRAGRLVVAPVHSSLKTLWHLARFKAAGCKAGCWSPVETRA